MFNFKKFFLSLVLFLITTGAYASNQGVYKVEVVIFTQPKAANASENWLSGWQLTPEKIESLLANKNRLLALNSAPLFINHLNKRIRIVGSAGNGFYSMNKQLRKYGRRILVHKPFILRISSHPTTLVFESSLKKAGIPELFGSFNISVGKYFHFQSKAIFNDLSKIDASTASNSQNPTGAYTSALLFETRKMRSGELHYLDNPFFGIIVRIDKINN